MGYTLKGEEAGPCICCGEDYALVRSMGCEDAAFCNECWREEHFCSEGEPERSLVLGHNLASCV